MISELLRKDRLTLSDFETLISPEAGAYLEPLLQRARDLTLQRFGRNIALYAPLYVSNECVNTCTYCGFSRPHRIKRRTLSLDEVELEGRALRSTGIQNVLLLTGESPKHNPVPYLLECCRILSRIFHTVQIEIYPLTEDQYRSFHQAGCEGVTVYQETYNRTIYEQVHTAGFKKDYDSRLETPVRAANGGIRRITIGALLGLAPWREEMFALAKHLDLLRRLAWRSDLSLSFPRIREAAQYIPPEYSVSDRDLVQIIAAFRLFAPEVGINLSTREHPTFRDGMFGLGVTSVSAGSRTDIGGYSSEANSTEQFEIEDTRTVAEVAAAIRSRGYEPVFKEWDRAFSLGTSDIKAAPVAFSSS